MRPIESRMALVVVLPINGNQNKNASNQTKTKNQNPNQKTPYRDYKGLFLAPKPVIIPIRVIISFVLVMTHVVGDLFSK